MRLSIGTKSAVTAIASILIAACSTSGGYGTASSTGYSNTTSATAERPAASVSVAIRNFTFEPAQIRISAGDTIVFVNEDTAPHTATAIDGAFNTGQLNTGESGSFTATTAGTLDYFCAIHPAMKATIIVE